MRISKIEAFVLNSMVDDCENLEQIYKSIAFEFSSDLHEVNPKSFYLRPNKEFSYSLDIVIETLIKFVNEGIISIRNPEDINKNINNSFIWKCWFDLTEKGKLLLNKNEHYFDNEGE